MASPSNRLKLHGFNNLTKTLSFNIYDIAFADSAEQHRAYIAHIDGVYNAERLTQILTDVANIIGANILNIARQDYCPQGASVTVLVAEEPMRDSRPLSDTPAPGPLPEAVVAHLDKSHLTAHTYPEAHPTGGVSTFRVDIDISTCGCVSPLNALNYLIHSFESDIVILDYRVRGFTRDVEGGKHFIDHGISSIRDYLSPDTLRKYETVDVNLRQENLFHTKMMVKDFVLNDNLFCIEDKDLAPRERDQIQRRLHREMQEIFYGKNL